MCDPVTAAAGAAAVLQAGGTIMSGYQQMQVGQYQQKLANTNARAAELSADTNEAIKRNQSERDIASQTVALAGQGNRVDTGTPLLLLAESARNAELDALAIRQQGVTQGVNYRAQGAAAAAEGQNAFTGSFFTAAGNLLNASQGAAGQHALAALGAI